MKYCATLLALVASVMAGPVEIVERQITVPGVTQTGAFIPGPTITLPNLSIPGISIPGVAIPTSFVIPGFSTVIPLPSVCPTDITVAIPAATINVPVAAITGAQISASASGKIGIF